MTQGLRLGAVLGVGFAALALVGCTSSGPPQPPASPTPSPSTSAAPSTPASTPTPTPTTSAALSPFEQDPAVKALRAWAAEVARTINDGKYDSAALNTLMTSQLATTMKNLAGPEVGRRYPGPLPLTPIRVTASSSTSRDMRACFVSNGFSLDPKTKKPFDKRHVQAVDAAAVLRSGRWLVSKFDTGTFSCAGVSVREPSF